MNDHDLHRNTNHVTVTENDIMAPQQVIIEIHGPDLVPNQPALDRVYGQLDSCSTKIETTVVKMVDYSYTTIVSHPRRSA